MGTFRLVLNPAITSVFSLAQPFLIVNKDHKKRLL